MLKKITLGLALLAFGLGVSRCASMVDTVNANDGRALTLVMRGCGQPWTRGYVFCELEAKSTPSGFVEIALPTTKCPGGLCGEIEVFTKGGAVLRRNVGESGRVRLALTELLDHSDPVEIVPDDQEMLVIARFFYDGEFSDTQVILQGAVRVWITERGFYHLECGSRFRGGKIELLRRCRAEYTTGGRSAICGRGC